MRRQETMVPICHWCKIDLTEDDRYRTPLEGVEPYGSAGWFVCGPECPERPQDVIVFRRPPFGAAQVAAAKALRGLEVA